MKLIRAGMVLMLSGCCFGGELGMNEASFSSNMNDLKELAENTDGDLKKDIEAEIDRFEEAYEKLPEDEKKRAAELDRLWNEQEEVIEKFEKRQEELADASKSENIEKIKGVWQGDGISLSIDAGGQVVYEKKKGATSKSINAPIQKFQGDRFEVGAFGLTTTFVIDEWPHEDDGETKMKVDGVVLTRIEEK